LSLSRSENIAPQVRSLTIDQRKALHALIYFDLFNYPLKSDEIKLYSSVSKNTDVDKVMIGLVDLGVVFKISEFYALSANPDHVQNRLRGNIAAVKMLRTAKRMSKFISRFPYVRLVSISGSLSKGYSDELGDIDYFIITKPGRLWIARSILITFKKVFLLNSKKYFCVNYFIDTDHLEIPDKNIFTATEVLTLVPMYDPEILSAFSKANSWASDFLPNLTPRSVDEVHPRRSYLFKSMIEFFLNGVLGEKLDGFMMKMTMKRWQGKFDHFTPEYFEHALRSRKYVSKHHPQNFQKKVLDSLESSVYDFEKQHGLSLDLTNG
jgi:predicted nucleotidyltransferase